MESKLAEVSASERFPQMPVWLQPLPARAISDPGKAESERGAPDMLRGVQRIRSGLLQIVALSMLFCFVSGCRNTWTHPEATEEKYAHEIYLCRYGVELPTEEEIRRRVADRPGALRSDWGQCMELLGWDRDTRMRWAKPWDSD